MPAKSPTAHLSRWCALFCLFAILAVGAGAQAVSIVELGPNAPNHAPTPIAEYSYTLLAQSEQSILELNLQNEPSDWWMVGVSFAPASDTTLNLLNAGGADNPQNLYYLSGYTSGGTHTSRVISTIPGDEYVFNVSIGAGHPPDLPNGNSVVFSASATSLAAIPESPRWALYAALMVLPAVFLAQRYWSARCASNLSL